MCNGLKRSTSVLVPSRGPACGATCRGKPLQSFPQFPLESGRACSAVQCEVGTHACPSAYILSINGLLHNRAEP
eukprot:1159942-Pelagomonas_calceolata.AAC.1